MRTSNPAGDRPAHATPSSDNSNPAPNQSTWFEGCQLAARQREIVRLPADQQISTVRDGLWRLQGFVELLRDYFEKYRDDRWDIYARIVAVDELRRELKSAGDILDSLEIK